jgi:hypothetical protein
VSLGPSAQITIDYPGSGTVSRTTANGPVTAAAVLLPFVLLRQKSDEILGTTSAATTGTQDTSPQVTVTEVSDSRGPGMAAGTVAGIAVGSAAGGILLLLLGMLLFRRRRRGAKQQEQVVAGQSHDYGADSKPELPSQSVIREARLGDVHTSVGGGEGAVELGGATALERGYVQSHELDVSRQDR